MAKISSLNARLDDSLGRQTQGIVQEIRALLDDLSPQDRARVLREVQSTPGPRAGEVLGTVVQLIVGKREWTTSEIRAAIAKKGVSASPKEVYNAVGYLARLGHVKRVGYGKYLVGGAGFETLDDIGIEPTRDECE